MIRKLAPVCLIGILLAALLLYGGGGTESVSSVQTSVGNAQALPTAGPVTVGQPAATPVAVATAASSVTEAVAENQADHSSGEDETWDGSLTADITLQGDSVTVQGTGVEVDGSVATITAAGTYRISGKLSDGRMVVDAADDADVRVVLDGADITFSTGAPFAVMAADEVDVYLADGSNNRLVDGSQYVLPEGEDEPNAALYSKADLTISGTGVLMVEGNYNDGIGGKDGLTITGGTITVTAVDDGIRGKDYVIVKDGVVSVEAGGDGLKADNEEDETRGYVNIEGGELTVVAGGDGVDARTDVLVSGGVISVTSGGGSTGLVSADASAKGLKGVVSVIIDGGMLSIDSADDAIHSNGSVVINGGTFDLSTGDDGVHADASLQVNGGDMTIRNSYEGIESQIITVSGGYIDINASDDGVNVSGGQDGSGMFPGPGRRGGGGRGGETFAATAATTGSQYLLVVGGTIVVQAEGDGVDANGTIEMTGGVLLVNGPTQSMNGALDHAGFTMSGGTLVAVGSAGMAQAPDQTSVQYTIVVTAGTTQEAGSLVHVRSVDGTEVLTFRASKPYQSVVVSSPDLVSGGSYEVYFGGSHSGESADGLYEGGSYTPGNVYADVTLTSPVTTVGGRARW